MKQNDPIVPKQTSYARVLSGEIPILFDYDFNAYRAKYKDQANVVFVIPAEGSIVVPYVMSLVKNGPHPEEGKKVLTLSCPTPVRLFGPTPSCARCGLRLYPRKRRPSSSRLRNYERAKPIDYGKMAEAQNGFSERYLSEVARAGGTG